MWAVIREGLSVWKLLIFRLVSLLFCYTGRVCACEVTLPMEEDFNKAFLCS